MKAALKSIVLTAAVLAIAAIAQPAHAQLLDLSAVNSSGEINDALFARTVLHGEGTGVLKPFVRIQGKDPESGYNTDGTLEFDTKPGAWTHSILFSDIPVVNINGVDYREFLLDAGEPGQDKNTLQLDIMEIYLLDQPDVTGYPANFPTSKRIYQLVDADHNGILLDNITGNGIADMFAYVPDSLFSGDAYLYFYSKFSLSEGTFEEWGTQENKDGHVIPEPTSLPSSTNCT